MQERELGELPEWLRAACMALLGFALFVVIFSIVSGKSDMRRISIDEYEATDPNYVPPFAKPLGEQDD